MNTIIDPVRELENLVLEADRLLAKHRRPITVRVESRLASIELDAWGLAHNIGVASPLPALWELDAEFDRLLDLGGLALQGAETSIPEGVLITPHYDAARPAPSPYERLINGGSFDQRTLAQADIAVEQIEGRGRAGGAYAVVYPGGAVASVTLTDEEDPDLVPGLMDEALAEASEDARRQVEELVQQGLLDRGWAITKMLLTNPYKENAHA